MRKLKITLLVLVGLLVLIQLIPVSKTNPEVSGDIQADAAFKQLLRRSCYNCHSNETEWPWYSHAAPVSWLVAKDVNEARERLNFSVWEEYSAADRQHLKKEIVNEVTKGNMPLGKYLILHPEAKLSEADLELFKGWEATQDRRQESDEGDEHAHTHEHH